MLIGAGQNCISEGVTICSFHEYCMIFKQMCIVRLRACITLVRDKSCNDFSLKTCVKENN